MRLAEAETVHKTLTKYLGIRLTVVDASQRFLDQLRGITDPEQKRKVIGRNFIEVFQETAKKIEEAAVNSPNAGDIDWLLQGTLYPDIIESISFKGKRLLGPISFSWRQTRSLGWTRSQLINAPGYGIPATY